MEEYRSAAEMLYMLDRPAFSVADGKIAQVNQAARSRMVEAGMPVAALLVTGAQEYEELAGGYLFLKLSIAGRAYGATVTRFREFDLFVLEPEEAPAELKALSLAAVDLRRPLNSLFSAVRTLEKDAPQAEEAQKSFSQVNRGLNQLHRIVSNMADAYQYAQQSTLKNDVRNLAAIIRDVFDHTAALAEAKGVTVSLRDEAGDVYALADALLLERAIYNLLSNALKHVPQGGKIEGHLVHRGQKLSLTITDSGEGIPEAVLSSVFSRYQREPSARDGQDGIGLGMVIVRAAALLHGGTVLMELPKEGGTRITMTLQIRNPSRGAELHSPIVLPDYAGGRDHSLLELSDVLPWSIYQNEDI